MIKTQIIYAEGLYIIKGRSAAGSVFVEDLIEAKKFITLLNKRLAGYLFVHDFLITEDSWTLLCRIEDSKSVITKYELDRERSTKVDPLAKLEEVWRIISEQFRLLLSIFVKFTNRKQGRTGSKVHSNYERYYFENEQEAESYMQQMKNQAINNSQCKRKYRGKRGLYRVSKLVEQGHVYLCTRRVGVSAGNSVMIYGVGAIEILDILTDVLRKLINSTFSNHSIQKAPS